MVHIEKCLEYKRSCFGFNDFQETKKKKLNFESPMTPTASPCITSSPITPVVDMDSKKCIIPFSLHAKGKLANTTQSSIIFKVGKKELRLCEFKHLEGVTKDKVFEELEAIEEISTDPIDTSPSIECKYKFCKKSDIEGTRLSNGEISVRSGANPELIIYSFCSKDCLWRHVTLLSKSTFTNEYSRLSKKK
jgi:hypothetical protein